MPRLPLHSSRRDPSRPDPREFARARARMVEAHLVARGLYDPRLLAAFRTVPREAFVAPELAADAYRDQPLPIGEGQTISQPYVVALMIDLARVGPGDRVLEIGTGSGYSAAVLAQMAGEVYSVERFPELAERAAERLAVLGYAGVHVRCGDGTLGWPEHAPYDAIVVMAGGPQVPPALKRQLMIGGRLVVPVGPVFDDQVLMRITRLSEQTYREQDFGPVRFVPLIGEEGWGV
jgi:protein-L-isoaspartate(D-aspartate) O-methyltransferase